MNPTKNRIDLAVTELLTIIDKYDNGIITRQQLGENIRLKTTEAINETWDFAFEVGLRESEDDDDGYEDEYEIELDEDEEEDDGN